MEAAGIDPPPLETTSQLHENYLISSGHTTRIYLGSTQNWTTSSPYYWVSNECLPFGLLRSITNGS